MRVFRPWALVALVLAIAVGVWRWSREASKPLVVSDDAANRPETKPVVSQTSFHWTTGSTQTYRLSAKRTLQFSSADNKTDSFSLGIDGRLVTKVLRVDPATVVMLAQLSSLQFLMNGAADGRQSLVTATKAPFLLVSETDGKLRALRFSKQVDPVSRGFLKGLMASVQFVRNKTQAGQWQTQELDATGEFEALYALQSDGKSVSKRRGKYLQARSVQGLMPIGQLGAVSGRLEVAYVLSDGDDEAARVASVEGLDELTVLPGPDMPRIRSWSSFSLLRQSGENLPVTESEQALLSTDEYALSPLALMDATENDGRDDEQQVKGAKFSDLLSLLVAVPASDDGSERAVLQTRLSALFRLHPDAAAEAGEAIGRGLNERAAKTLLGALSGAQNTKGQAALVDVFKNSKLSADLREHAVAVLGLADAPSDESVQALLDGVRDRDTEMSNTAALALGNAAQAERKSGQLGTAENLVDVLLARFEAATNETEQSAALEALGNTGDPRIVPVVQNVLGSGNEMVRVSAVRALRFVAGGSVDALLGQLVTRDASGEVRLAALMAISFRPLLLFVEPLGQTVLRDAVSSVRMEALLLLGKMRDLPKVPEVLRTVAERDTDPQVRQKAASMLAD